VFASSADAVVLSQRDGHLTLIWESYWVAETMDPFWMTLMFTTVKNTYTLASIDALTEARTSIMAGPQIWKERRKDELMKSGILKIKASTSKLIPEMEAGHSGWQYSAVSTSGLIQAIFVWTPQAALANYCSFWAVPEDTERSMFGGEGLRCQPWRWWLSQDGTWSSWGCLCSSTIIVAR
jgi:hypothetical protein